MSARARGFIEAWHPRAETWELLCRIKKVLDEYLPAKAWIGQDNWQKTVERRNSGLTDHFSKTVVVLIRGARSGGLADAPVLPRSRRAAASRSHLVMMGAERHRIEASR